MKRLTVLIFLALAGLLGARQAINISGGSAVGVIGEDFTAHTNCTFALIMEDTAGVIEDVCDSGTDHDGTINLGSFAIDGTIKYMTTTGVDGANITDTPALEPGSDLYTFSCLVHEETAPFIADEFYAGKFEDIDFYADNDGGGGSCASTGNDAFSARREDGFNAACADGLSQDTWYGVAMRDDGVGAGTYDILLDGVEVDTIASADITDTTNNWQFLSDTSQRLADCILFLGVALTDAQICELHNYGLEGNNHDRGLPCIP